MTFFIRLSGLLLGLALLQLSSCTAIEHAALAPRLARHTYHRAERHNARVRRHTRPALIFWN